MAGPEVTRIGTSNSLATIMAKVVLPSPGGPASRIWSGGTSRFRAASRKSCNCALSTWLSDESLEDMRTKLLVADRLVADGCGGNHTEGFLVRPGVRLFECISVRHNGPFHLPAIQRCQRELQHAWNILGVQRRLDLIIGADRLHRMDSVLLVPSQRHQTFDDLFGPSVFRSRSGCGRTPRHTGSDQWNLSVRG